MNRFIAFLLGSVVGVCAWGQVTTDATKTGIPNGTPTAITATTGTGSTMVLQSSPTLNTPTLSIPKLSTQTWANLPAASSNSWAVTVASDLGTNGSLVASNGTRWRPVNGEATLKSLAAPVSGVANSDTLVLQALIPAGAWQAGDVVAVRHLAVNKSGTTDTALVTVRVGTAGTTGDTVITGLSAAQGLTAAMQAGGLDFDLRLISNTSAQRVGNVAAGAGGFGAGSASAESAATTISDASANALYVTVWIKSGGTTNTVGASSCQIQLITP